MNIMFRSNINTHRRSIQDKNVKIACKPFCKHYPLLVSSRKCLTGIVWVWGCNRQFFYPVVDFGFSFGCF